MHFFQIWRINIHIYINNIKVCISYACWVYKIRPAAVLVAVLSFLSHMDHVVYPAVILFPCKFQIENVHLSQWHTCMHPGQLIPAVPQCWSHHYFMIRSYKVVLGTLLELCHKSCLYLYPLLKRVCLELIQQNRVNSTICLLRTVQAIYQTPVEQAEHKLVKKVFHRYDHRNSVPPLNEQPNCYE